MAFAATGVGEVAEQAKAGDVRILAVTSEEPVEGVDAPTLHDEGIDLVFSNWRGIVAPPGISDGRHRRSGSTSSPRCTTATPWQEALEDEGWTDAFITGDEFATFLTDESDRVERRAERAGPGMTFCRLRRYRREQGRSELGVALFLAALGVLVVVHGAAPAGEPDRPRSGRPGRGPRTSSGAF